MSYDTYKVIHLLGVVLFLGNIIVTALWKAQADRTRDPRIIAYAQRLVSLTDILFTAGGIAVLLIGAFGMIVVGHLDAMHTPWLVWAQALLGASAVIWVAVLLPIQFAQARLARGFADGSAIPPRYWVLNTRWMIFGILATVIPLCNLYVMVFKPQ